MPSPPLSIVQSLSPRIAVLTSEEVVQSCEANGCRGLEELLRPWEGSSERVSIMSSTLIPTIHPSFPLRFVSYDSIFGSSPSPNPEMVVDMVGSLVGSKSPDDEVHYPVTRSLLLSSRPLVSHETFNHAVGVLLAISTATLNPVGRMAELYSQTLGGSTPWMDGVNVLRFYVVVHDVSLMGEDLEIAHTTLANVKKAYGPHSTLLVINSRLERTDPPSSPDVTSHPTIPLPQLSDDINPSALSQVYASALSSLTLSPTSTASIPGTQAVANTSSSPSKPARRKLYASKLSAEDTQRRAALVRELVVQSLVPWMEARVREWNEVYLSNRRGITGRLFGAGRKFFGGSRPASPAVPTGYNAVKGFYPVAAIETLTRRLADTAFMLRDYKFASSVYDSLRRDYAQDRAWRYASAATEMYGLSLLLSHPYFLPTSPPNPPHSPFTTLQHTDISSWLEQAVLAYQSRSPPGQIQLDAMRITVLYYEAWKAIGEYRGIGLALVRAAGESDEVPSAVLIEEAASADVKIGKGRGRRRRAFHLVIAARRYETAGLKPYSRRCLDRASQIYRDAPWTAAQDRIEYSLGRQAYTLGESSVAVQHFLRLLGKNGTSSQSGVLEDLALAYEQLVSHPEMSDKVILELPTPIFDIKKTKVIVGNQASTSGTSEEWSQLESVHLDNWDTKGKRPMRLLPEKRVTASVGETFQIELTAVNPLNAPLVISDLTLQTTSSENVTIETIPTFTLDPHQTRLLTIGITSSTSQELTLQSASYLFNNFLPVSQSLTKRGKRLHTTKEQRMNPSYGVDKSLTVDVLGRRARLEVSLEVASGVVGGEMLEGEEVNGDLVLKNCGSGGVEGLKLITNHFGMIRLRDHAHDNLIASSSSQVKSISNAITPNQPINLPSTSLEADHTIRIPIVITAPPQSGTINLLCLLACNTTISNEPGSHQFSYTFNVTPLGRISASSRPSKKDPQSYLVGVQVYNESEATIQIEGVECVSPYWPNTSSTESTYLPPNQIYTTYLELATPAFSSLDLHQAQTVVNLGNLLRGQALDSTPFPPFDLPIASDNYSSSRREYRISYLRTNFPTLPLETIEKVFPLFDPLDLDLIVSWSLPSLPVASKSPTNESTPRRGKIHFHGLRLHPAFSLVESLRAEVDALILSSGGAQKRTMYEETGRLRRVLVGSVLDGVLGKEEDPVVISVSSPLSSGGSLVWDFAKGALTLPVKFDIQNRSPILGVRYILSLPSTPHYIGQQVFTGTIPPGGVGNVEVGIWVVEGGLISLSGWELEVETGMMGGGEGEQGRDQEDKEWVPRMSWSRIGEGGLVEVVQQGS